MYLKHMNSDPGVQNFNPLLDPPPADVKLRSAPLALVVTQLRFASIGKIEDRAYIASFQELVRKDYPLLGEDKISFTVNLGMPVAPTPSNTRTRWHMTSIDGAWRLILTQDFIALETSKYHTRQDFLGRWGRILKAFRDCFQDVTGLRFGLRYLNRVSDPGLLARLPELVRKEALGIASILPHPPASITETHYSVPEGMMLARWGFLHPGATHDASISPVALPSWVLDYDLYEDREQTGNVVDLESIGAKAEAFSLRGYAFFRWMVTDEFLSAHGAER